MDSVNVISIRRLKFLAILAGTVLFAEIVALAIGVSLGIALFGLLAVATTMLALAGTAITYVMHQHFMALVLRTENFDFTEVDGNTVAQQALRHASQF